MKTQQQPQQPNATIESASPLDETETGMDFYAAYETDADAEDAGVWVAFRGGIEFRIRSQSSPRVRRSAHKINSENRREIVKNRGEIDPKLQDATTVELLARAVVSDWRFPKRGAAFAHAIPARDGSPIAYSTDAVREFFADRRMRALRDEVMLASSTDETFRVADVAEMAGNSSASSGGASDSATTRD